MTPVAKPQSRSSRSTHPSPQGIPPTYDGLTRAMIYAIKYEANRLIGSVGYTKSDRGDIEAELAWHLRQALPKHDPAKSRLMTFVSMVLDSKAAKMTEARKTRYFDFRDHAFSLDEQVAGEDGVAQGRGDLIDEDEYLMSLGRRSMPQIGLVELQIAVRQTMDSLPLPLRKTCQLMLEHGSICEASRHTGIPRATLYHQVKKLRQAFQDAGF